MATPKQVTEPAAVADSMSIHSVQEPAKPAQRHDYDPNKRVKAVDKSTGEVLRRSVPETWLDGRFPNLKAAPSNKKEGK